MDRAITGKTEELTAAILQAGTQAFRRVFGPGILMNKARKSVKFSLNFIALTGTNLYC
jgi:hypothetical protein